MCAVLLRRATTCYAVGDSDITLCFLFYFKLKVHAYICDRAIKQIGTISALELFEYKTKKNENQTKARIENSANTLDELIQPNTFCRVCGTLAKNLQIQIGPSGPNLKACQTYEKKSSLLKSMQKEKRRK